MATLTVNELSEQLETTPRTARKFLRAVTEKENQPGKGGRWQIEKRDVRGLVKKFATWQDEHTRTPEVPNDDEPDADSELADTETE